MTVRFQAPYVLEPQGWRSPAIIEVSSRGVIQAVREEASDEPPPDVRLEGFVVPGLANLHSHAFQRALSGLTEHAAAGQIDSFWTWRTQMYALALTLTPEDLEAVAAQLFVEMLEAGMTAAGEFHYLHHAPDGDPYAPSEEMGLRILNAAELTGMAVTLLPVLYLTGGFRSPPKPEQRRFVHADLDAFLNLFERLDRHISPNERHRIGAAPHSLRAVPSEDLLRLVDAIRPEVPIHIHIAEQTLEVEEAVACLGDRPVRWLLDHAPVDERWCLVHATHLEPEERQRLAASKAVVGLCPTTEANLGDGIFPTAAFLAEGGRFGIGSDSHVSVSISEELRWLEYVQRLTHQQRNVTASELHPHTGRGLFERAARGGAKALAQSTGSIAPGQRADFVVLDPSHSRLVGHDPDTVLDAFIFGGADGAISEVWVQGHRWVEGGRHLHRETVATRYAAAMTRIRGEIAYSPTPPHP